MPQLASRALKVVLEVAENLFEDVGVQDHLLEVALVLSTPNNLTHLVYFLPFLYFMMPARSPALLRNHDPLALHISYNTRSILKVLMKLLSTPKSH